MNKKILCIAFLTLALALPALAFAGGKKDEASNGPWIHIEVREHDGDGATVNVNLPISLADVALQMVQEKSGKHGHGRILIEDDDFTVEDMRAMWDEVRKAGEAEFVNAKDGDETVTVSRKGESVLVNVTGDDGEKVRIELPVAVVDALLSGEGNELDMAAAIGKMKDMKKGEIVSVEDGEDTVRIWID